MEPRTSGLRTCFRGREALRHYQQLSATSGLIRERWNWKPERALYALVLRAYWLDRPVEIPFQASYGGCKSQIELADPVAIDRWQPAIADERFEAASVAVCEIFS